MSDTASASPVPPAGTRVIVFAETSGKFKRARSIPDDARVDVQLLKEIASLQDDSPTSRTRWLSKALASNHAGRVYAALEIFSEQNTRKRRHHKRRGRDLSAGEQKIVARLVRLNPAQYPPPVRRKLIRAIMSAGILLKRDGAEYDQAVKMLVTLAGDSEKLIAQSAIGRLQNLRAWLNPRAGGYNWDGSFPRRPVRAKFGEVREASAKAWRAWYASGGHHKPNTDIAKH